jgi:antitoxin YefM
MTRLFDELCAYGRHTLGLRLAPRGPGSRTVVKNLVILVTMTETLPLAQVKAHLSELVGRVNSQHDRVTVTVHGRPSAVLLSLDDLESLEETIVILSDTDTLRQLAASDAELARGEGETEQSLAEAMRRRGAST